MHPSSKVNISAFQTATTSTTTALAMEILSQALEFSLMTSSFLDLVMALFVSGGNLDYQRYEEIDLNSGFSKALKLQGEKCAMILIKKCLEVPRRDWRYLQQQQTRRKMWEEWRHQARQLLLVFSACEAASSLFRWTTGMIFQQGWIKGILFEELPAGWNL